MNQEGSTLLVNKINNKKVFREEVGKEEGNKENQAEDYRASSHKSISRKYLFALCNNSRLLFQKKTTTTDSLKIALHPNVDMYLERP